MWELQGERLITAAGAIAGATRVFEYTMDYAQNRKAFGQPISQFQVLKHKLVDMGTRIAAVQSLVYQTAKQWDAGEYPVREISQSKLLATSWLVMLPTRPSRSWAAMATERVPVDVPGANARLARNRRRD